jgi:hypothetical protein
LWRPEFTVIAGLGVIASAYAALVSSRSTVNQDSKNAERYQATGDHLRERRLDLDVYRERVATGDEQALQELFEPVFIALEADHRAFLNETEQRELAIGDMEKRLDAAKRALETESAKKR